MNIVRNVGLCGEPMNEGSHALIHYEDVRVPEDALLGGEGQAFVIAQTRLGGGRIHHAMRTIGLAQKAFDMMCERALSRETQGSLLADKQFVQGYIADSYAQLVQFRLFVLYTAWEIDKYNDYKRVRKDIATAKVVMPTVLHDIAWRAMQVHGALGTTNEMPFFGMIHGAGVMGLADGPTEVHKVTVARQVLRDYRPGRGHVADRVDPREDRRRQGAVRPPARAGGRQPVIDVDRLAAWMDDEGLPGKGEPLEHRFISGGSQNEIYEIRRGELHGALRIPPPSAPESRDEGICASGASSRRSTAPTCRTPRPSPACKDTDVLGRAFYVMGFVDGWSPMGLETARRERPWPAPFDTDLEARQGLAYQLVEGIALLGNVDWRAKGPRGPRPARRLPRAPGRPVDRVPRADQGPRAARLRRGRRLAAGARADRLRARADARRLPVRQRDVPTTARRRGWPRSSTGRWARSATRSSTSAGSCRAGPRTR